MFSSAKTILYRTRVFYPLRTAYRAVFDRREFVFARRMREFYSQWIRNGDIVFDIGANHGIYAETFSSLGAHVIAVEPNPALCDKLSLIARSRDVVVERCAVGEAPGKAKMRLYDIDALGTISTEQSLSSISQGARLQGEIEVEVVTLDQLVGKHGKPSFVKVDAEGYDEKVLHGASFCPAGLSFEFSRDNADLSMRCFDAPVLAEGYQFNVMAGRRMEYASELWLTKASIQSHIVSLIGDEEYGDVFAQRIRRGI